MSADSLALVARKADRPRRRLRDGLGFGTLMLALALPLVPVAVWSISGAERIHELAELFRASRLYIADGHHRYETALNFRNKQRMDHPEAPPDAAFRWSKSIRRLR